MKLAIAGAVVAIIVAFAIAKVVQRRGEETERAEAERRAAQRFVDLAAAPDPATKPAVAEEPPKPKLGKKPVIVELAFKQKRGKKLAPFVGAFQVVNATGHTVADGEVDPLGEPTIMILSPGEYEVRVPAKKFKKAIGVFGTEGERMNVTVLVR